MNENINDEFEAVVRLRRAIESGKNDLSDLQSTIASRQNTTNSLPANKRDLFAQGIEELCAIMGIPHGHDFVGELLPHQSTRSGEIDVKSAGIIDEGSLVEKLAEIECRVNEMLARNLTCDSKCVEKETKKKDEEDETDGPEFSSLLYDGY